MSRKKGTLKYKHAVFQFLFAEFLPAKVIFSQRQAAAVISNASLLKGSILGVSKVSIASCFVFTSWFHNFCISLGPRHKIQSWRFSQHTTFSAPNPHLDVNMNFLAKKLAPQHGAFFMAWSSFPNGDEKTYIWLDGDANLRFKAHPVTWKMLFRKLLFVFQPICWRVTVVVSKFVVQTLHVPIFMLTIEGGALEILRL